MRFLILLCSLLLAGCALESPTAPTPTVRLPDRPWLRDPFRVERPSDEGFDLCDVPTFLPVPGCNAEIAEEPPPAP